jgi:hypothetical protein
MSILYRGDLSFDDICEPLKGKNDWGVDTLVRRVKGPRSLAAAYIATLAQGQVYQGYYLQTWTPDEQDPVWAEITLNYKGFVSGGTPAPLVSVKMASAKGTTSADYTSENSGLGRLYMSSGVPGGIIARYTTGAVMEFTYKSIQSSYKYIHQGMPLGPDHTARAISIATEMRDARITTSNGSIYGSERMSFFGLTPVNRDIVVSFSGEPIAGTIFYECEDVIGSVLENAVPGGSF